MQDSKRVKNRLLDSVREGEGGMIWENSIETHISYHMWNRWPVQVWCMKQGTQSQCTEAIQMDGMGRDVGGGVQNGGGDTCTPLAYSCQCMAKTTTIL